MKTWKHKVKMPVHGICTVKEARGKDVNGMIAPIDHGFVNLYKDGKWVAYCGVFYARDRVIKNKKKK